MKSKFVRFYYLNIFICFLIVTSILSCETKPSTGAFLSDTDPGFAYLETLQKISGSYCSDEINNTKTPPLLKHLIAKLVSGLSQEEDSKEIEKDIANQYDTIDNIVLPTRCENRENYAQLIEIANWLEQIVDYKFKQHPPFPVFGTLRTQHLNAYSLCIPKIDKTIIVFNSSLISFIRSMARIVTEALVIKEESGKIEIVTEPELVITRVLKNPSMLKQFAGVLVSILRKEYIYKQLELIRSEIQMPFSYRRIADTLEAEIIIFVMAHEYVHILHNHQGDNRLKMLVSDNIVNIEKSINDKKTFIEVIERNHLKEIEADIFGNVILMESFRNTNIYNVKLLGLSASRIFMIFLELIEKAREIIGMPNIISHPPASVRREVLDMQLNFFKEAGHNEIERDLSKEIYPIIMAMWETTKDLIIKLYHSSNEDYDNFLLTGTVSTRDN